MPIDNTDNEIDAINNLGSKLDTAPKHMLAKSAHVTVEPINKTESRIINSHTLFNGQRQIVISHAGDQYILRVTKQGKLILTK